ncbi:tetratricopeptide repeat protein [bacterium]|nr:tetratricopeptide repeat protein [bacterium]
MKKWFLFLLMVSVSTVAFSQDDEDDSDDSDSPCENIYGEDSVQTIRDLSMFNQYYQEKNWEKTLPYWKALFENSPCIKKRITYNGPYIIKKCLITGNYDERKAGLIDTILLCYEKRLELFGENCAVRLKYATDIASLQPSRRAEALDMYYTALEECGNSTPYNIPRPFMLTAQKAHEREALSLDSLFMAFEMINDIIDYNINANGPKVDKWKSAQEDVTKIMLPYLDCDKLVELKKPLFDDKKTDLSYLKSTLYVMSKGNCSGSDFYIELSEQYYSLEPSTDAAMMLARAFLKRDNYTKAEKYYKEAISGLEGTELHDAYIRLAQLSIQNSKLSQARDYARKALEVNPNSGDAYILIGDAYAATRGCSGSCAELGGREVYWAAVDKYYKAKQVDPSVADKANEKISKYSQYFPDKEKAFFCGLIDGQSYSVGCWIGETTTIRTISSN